MNTLVQVDVQVAGHVEPAQRTGQEGGLKWAHALLARATAYAQAWGQRIARARADAHMWDMALRDPRLMAEIEAAKSRAQG